MARQFMALRVVGTIFKVLAWLVLILGLLGAAGGLIFGFAVTDELGIAGLDIGGPLVGIATFVVAVVVAILNFLLLYAVGEVIYLSLCIEENTRRTAYLLQQQTMPPEPAYSPPTSPPGYVE